MFVSGIIKTNCIQKLSSSCYYLQILMLTLMLLCCYLALVLALSLLRLIVTRNRNIIKHSYSYYLLQQLQRSIGFEYWSFSLKTMNLSTHNKITYISIWHVDSNIYGSFESLIIVWNKYIHVIQSKWVMNLEDYLDVETHTWHNYRQNIERTWKIYKSLKGISFLCKRKQQWTNMSLIDKHVKYIYMCLINIR